jgi:hypothetical protein
MGNLPPVFLLNCVCDFIHVNPCSPRTAQAYFDRIRRCIQFHGKRRRPGVEAYLMHLDKSLIDRSWPTRTDQWLQWSAMR